MSDARDDRPRSPGRRKLLGGAVAGAIAGVPPWAPAATAARQSTVPDRERLVAIAHALLPAELPAAERIGVAEALLSWLRGYRAGVTMDHGYGFTRIEETDPSPAARYARELEAMDEEARSRWRAALTALSPERVRTLAAEAIERSAPDLETIPSRPDAPHVTIALLSAYYRSAAAADRAYEARIRRETCRGLFTDVDGLEPWSPGITDADRERRR